MVMTAHEQVPLNSNKLNKIKIYLQAKCKFNSKILAPFCKFLAAPLMHSILYCEVLASRTLPREMKEVLILSIEIVNYVKAGFRNSRLFKLLCQDMESEHAAMLFYINVRRLSKGNMLKRLHELNEVIMTNYSFDLSKKNRSDKLCQKYKDDRSDQTND